MLRLLLSGDLGAAAGRVRPFARGEKFAGSRHGGH
jgi:hypothetical protein